MADSTETKPARTRTTKARPAAKRPGARVRKKTASAAPAEHNDMKDEFPSHRPASLTGLAVLTVAIILGAVGFVLHILWIGAIIVMAVLWGSMISGRQVGVRKPRGVVSEVITAAVDEVREITDSLS